jgi:uncharacterized protein (DUF1499 family)
MTARVVPLADLPPHPNFAWLRIAVMVVLGVAAVAALLVAAAGYGYRWGWWDLGTGFGLLPYGGYIGGGAALAALIAGVLCLVLKRRRLALVATLALVMGGGALALPLSLKMRATSAPPIHDITTDFADPPGFVVLKGVREGSPNGATYGGSIVADQQRAAYPDIAPVLLNLPPPLAMAKVRDVARDMGWQVVASNADRLEATVTTPWFGFKDDVAIRVTAQDGGSRIDIRSVSRIGQSDLGTNARRVREVIERLKR